jgi:hypothetical protein
MIEDNLSNTLIMEQSAAPAAGGGLVGAGAVAPYPPYPSYFYQSGMVYNPMHGIWQEPEREGLMSSIQRGPCGHAPS